MVELPDPTDPQLLLAYLGNEGSAAVDFVAVTATLRDDAADCEGTAFALDDLGDPEQLLQVLNEVPDEVTRELLLGLFAVTGDRLADCRHSEVTSADAFRWQWEVASRRIADLGLTS